MKLNVGCGDHPAAGWVNVDLHDQGPWPDVIASILDLPFGDGTAELVYCGHVLEHIEMSDLPTAVSELRRVIADTGTLVVVGPDANLTAEHEPNLLPCVLRGTQRWLGDEHRWWPTGERTLRFVLERFDAGLVPVGSVPDVWPVVDRTALWQFAIEATPKET